MEIELRNDVSSAFFLTSTVSIFTVILGPQVALTTFRSSAPLSLSDTMIPLQRRAQVPGGRCWEPRRGIRALADNF